MASGTLRVRGRIDVGQFWPGKKSDADTVKVTVTHPFEFQPFPGAGFTATQAFDNAVVTGAHGRRPAIKNGQITIRLEGLDAPELHYPPPSAIKAANRTREQTRLFKKWYELYRQNYAEAATVSLANKLGGPNATVDCEVRTTVDQPNEVFDVYGRFVGEVRLPTFSINEWLLQEGWAIPAFYNSMNDSDVVRLLNCARQARGRRAWRGYRDRVSSGAFDWTAGTGARRPQAIVANS